jgi:glycerol-3-phosphate dehydrogenase
LNGRHGREADDLLADARPGERSRIAGTPTTWAEVRWSARNEAVTSIGDLMLRRTRLGLLLPGGGERVLGSVMEICREELGWDAVRADQERRRYVTEVRRRYSIPPRAGTNAFSAAGTDSSVTGTGPIGSPSA